LHQTRVCLGTGADLFGFQTEFLIGDFYRGHLFETAKPLTHASADWPRQQKSGFASHTHNVTCGAAALALSRLAVAPDITQTHLIGTRPSPRGSCLAPPRSTATGPDAPGEELPLRLRRLSEDKKSGSRWGRI
jgi:hypothetical protein